MPSNIPGFDDNVLTVGDMDVAYSRGGSGPPVLLLHGFPQTRAMWRRIAPVLAEDFTVVASDLRGYGDSGKPEGVAAMSFRNMALDQVALMKALGFDTFHMVGHDRGGRTAHRMGLDRPDVLRSLTVMDIVPTHLLLNDLRQDVARGYYHWFFLAQPAPFPETLIGHDPDHYYQSSLTGWGSAKLDAFDALDAYRASWRNPATIHTMCNDYRAAIDVDFGHDAQDLRRRITCPSLVMYGADGLMAKAYDVGASWADRLADMDVKAIPGGHFFPDTHPTETTAALHTFLTQAEMREKG